MERVPSSFLISFQIFENPSTNGWDLACGHTHSPTFGRRLLHILAHVDSTHLESVYGAPHLSWIFVTTDSLRFATLHETKFRVMSLARIHCWMIGMRVAAERSWTANIHKANFSQIEQEMTKPS